MGRELQECHQRCLCKGDIQSGKDGQDREESLERNGASKTENSLTKF